MDKKVSKILYFFSKKIQKMGLFRWHLVSEYIYEQVLVNTSDSYVSLS